MRSKDNKYTAKYSFKSQNKLYSMNTPLIMGVLNRTPDSFYSGSQNAEIDQAISKAQQMVENGVDILDVGGISTRSNADLMNSEEELKRVIPVIKVIREMYPDLLISIDTFRSDVARKAVGNGANIINDVYGGRYDDKMYDTVAELDVPYILMHSRGEASNMQDLCQYNDVVREVIFELSESVEKLRKKGVKDIIIDPGFGFAKDLKQNYELLANIDTFEVLNCPILIGISRKSMIYKLLGKTPAEALNGTTVLNTFSLLKNADIIRVHDVEEAGEAREIIRWLRDDL